MKKILITGAMALLVSSLAYGMDFNLDALTDMTYTSFMKNDGYNIMAEHITPQAAGAFEELRLKAKQQVDQVKFDFVGWIKGYPGRESVDYAIDSAYFSVENGPFVFYAGKQRIKWGTGLFWNPVDSLQPNPLDIYRPSEDLEGIYALRAELSNDIVTPSVIITPKPGAPYKGLDAAIQLYKLVGTCDIFLNYIYDTDSQNIGAAISWDLGVFVLNGQAALKQVQGSSEYKLGNKGFDSSYMAGITKTISDELSVVAEYYRNSTGMSNNDYSSAISSRTIPVFLSKKDYLAYTASYTWNTKFSISFTGLHGLDDGTSFLFPAVSYVENTGYDAQLALLQNISANGVKEGIDTAPIYGTVELRFNAYF